MNEMVERVAKAIEDTDGFLGEERCRALRDYRKRQARAAIAAMREPTQEMTLAMINTGSMGDCGWESASAESEWQAAIDAALKD